MMFQHNMSSNEKYFAQHIGAKKNESKLQHKFELIYNIIEEKSSEYEEQQ